MRTLNPTLMPAPSAAPGTTLNRELSAPWWRVGMVWLVISGPATVVVASFVTLGLAITRPDPPLVLRDAATAAEAPALQGRNHAAVPIQQPPEQPPKQPPKQASPPRQP